MNGDRLDIGDSVRLYCGDCIQVMKSMEDNSIDAIVTDPPAGIGFMGKTWDRAAAMTDVLPQALAECLRIAKPGAILLCWALPRTSHWTGLAIESAGWQIRDVITHHHGTGFPKNHNISQKLKDKGLSCTCRTDALECTPEETHHEATKTRSGLRSVRECVPSQVAEDVRRGSILRSSLLWDMASDESRDPQANGVDSLEGQGGLDGSEPGILPGEDVRPGQSGLEWRSDLQADARELHRAEVREMPCGPALDGAGGRVRDGASAERGPDGGKAARSRRSRASSRPHDPEQRGEQSGAMAGQRDAQGDGAWPLCDRCGKPMVSEGIGTALKPATEFWFLAQKPIRGTFAENVLAHGTGGLGVDACRIPGVKSDRSTYAQDEWTKANFKGQEIDPISGRYPANLVLSHGPDCGETCGEGCPVRLLGEQSGELASGSRKAGDYRRLGGDGRYGEWSVGPMPAILGDSGTAARFFPCLDHDPFIYAAKASRRDRNSGCDGLPEKPGGVGCERPSGSMHERYGESNGSGVSPLNSNHHPTVKSVGLMKWLCRLACPPGGTVLDPFCGSGSTGKACIIEGFRFIGIDQSAEYIEIASKRISGELANLDSSMPLFSGGRQ